MGDAYLPATPTSIAAHAGAGNGVAIMETRKAVRALTSSSFSRDGRKME
jgi:hypothetical protein